MDRLLETLHKIFCLINEKHLSINICYILININQKKCLVEKNNICSILNLIEEHLQIAGISCVSTMDAFMQNKDNNTHLMDMLKLGSFYVIMPITSLYMDPSELHIIQGNSNLKVLFVLLGNSDIDDKEFFLKIGKYISNFEIIDLKNCSCYEKILSELIKYILIQTEPLIVSDYNNIWNLYYHQDNQTTVTTYPTFPTFNPSFLNLFPLFNNKPRSFSDASSSSTNGIIRIDSTTEPLDSLQESTTSSYNFPMT